MSHTPGPWRVRNFSVIAYAATGHDDPSDVDYYAGHLVAESVEWAANRKLIAAAPDLLEALVAAEVALAVAQGYRAITRGPDGDRIVSSLGTVRDAIAKARGGS